MCVVEPASRHVPHILCLILLPQPCVFNHLIKLITRGLCRGMWDVAQQGIPMQPEHVARFRSHVLEGRWGAALALLPQLATDPDLETQVRPEGRELDAWWAHSMAPQLLS